MVPKPQSLILLVTRRDVQLEQCIVPRVPFSTQNSKKSCIIIFLEQQIAPKPAVAFKYKLSNQEFPGFHSSRQHKNIRHGFPIKTANVHPDDIFNAVGDANLKE